MPEVLINGEPGNEIPVDDRGLSYGDGLFETMALVDGRIRFLDFHLERLDEGCRRLGIAAPNRAALSGDIESLCLKKTRAVIKVIVTRGRGKRGYRISDSAVPTRIVSIGAWPDYPDAAATHGVNVCVCDTRLASNPRLAGIKHLNRLEQVLARMEWDDPDIQEGLMLDHEGHVVCGTMSNVFAVSQGVLMTPALDQCGVAGIMRRHILDRAGRLGIDTKTGQFTLDALDTCDELLLSNAIIGIWPVKKVGQRHLEPGPVTQKLQNSLLITGNIDCAD